MGTAALSRLGPLRGREFRLLFLGRLVAFFGNAMASVALAFAVLELTGSKADVGFVLAARTLPQVVFLLVGGIWADRLPRHHVMVASDLASAASQAAVAALLLTGEAELWHLVVLAAVNGSASAFFFPASSGIVPQTVEPEQIQQANALLRLGLNLSWIGGAASAGLLVEATSAGWAIAVDSASFAVGAGIIALMRLPRGLKMQGSSMLAELREGWGEFRSRTWLWVVVVQFSFVNSAQTAALFVLGPAVARDELGGAGAWGAILTCQTVGLILGGLVMLRLRPQRLLLAGNTGILVIALPLVLLAFPAPVAAIALGALVAGIGIEIFSVMWDTSMQQNIPQERLSRVYSYDALGSYALIPAAQAAIGPIAEGVGTRETLLAAAALVFAATLAVFAVPDVRNLRRRAAA